MNKNTFQERADYGFRKTFESDAGRDAYLQELAKRNRKKLGFGAKARSAYGRWMAIAASVAILLTAGLYFSTQDSTLTDADLFAAHYAPLAYSGEGVLRGNGEMNGEEAAQDKPMEAILAYQNGDYQKASTLFELYLTDHPEDIEHRLYLGLAQIKDAPLKAADQLKIVVEQSSQTQYSLKETALWYRALALVKGAQKEEACALLTAYSGDMSDFLRGKRAAFLEDCGE